MAIDFLLERMRPVLGSYRPPESLFESAGAWENTYELFNARKGLFRTNGELRQRRSPSGTGGFRLAVDSRRCGSPGDSGRWGSPVFSFFVHVEFDCASGTPPGLQRWTSSSKMAAAADDPPYLNSGLKKDGRVEGGFLEVRTFGQALRTRIPGACMAKWCLIEAVQRLPRERRSYSFSLLDEVDEVRHGQQLRFRGEAQALLADGERPLAVYEHLGAGVIPTTFWTDEQHRVLFVVSGIEIHVLKVCNGKPAAYTVKNPPIPLR